MKRSSSLEILGPKPPKEVELHYLSVRRLLIDIKDHFQSMLREIIVEVLKRGFV